MKFLNTFMISFILATFVLNGCAPCPGAKNLAYPQVYWAQDLMKYELSETCMLSKTNVAEKYEHEWRGLINGNDEIVFTFDKNLNYFRINHHADYESLREIFGKYISFFRMYSSEYNYSRGFRFTCVYRGWDVMCNLSSNSVQIICTSLVPRR